MYKDTGGESSYSIKVTLMCADVPSVVDEPTLVLSNTDQIVIKWEPPASDGGTPILGYEVYMKNAADAYSLIYDGSENPGGRQIEITSYNGVAFQQGDIYTFKVVANNWVGSSPDTGVQEIAVEIPSETDATQSVVSGTGTDESTPIKAYVAAEVIVRAIDSVGLDVDNSGDIFSLHVSNLCTKGDNFECEVDETAIQVLENTRIYVMDYVVSGGSYDGKDYIISTDLDKNVFAKEYTVPLDGIITVSVFLNKNGGAYVEYFENVFMDGPPAVTAIDPTINHDWGTGLITSSATDFVSARWYAKIRAPTTEDYFFTVEADDGIRMYFQGELKADRWDV